MSDALPIILISLAVATALGLHTLACRKGPLWLGGILPGVWAVTAGTLASQGHIAPDRSAAVAAAALAVLLWIWRSARLTRATPKDQTAESSRR